MIPSRRYCIQLAYIFLYRPHSEHQTGSIKSDKEFCDRPQPDPSRHLGERSQASMSDNLKPSLYNWSFPILQVSFTVGITFD